MSENRPPPRSPAPEGRVVRRHAPDSRVGDIRKLLDRAGRREVSLAPFAAASQLNGTSLRREILAAGVIGETQLYSAIAEELGLRFDPEVDASRLLLRERTLAATLRAQWAPTMALAEAPAGASIIYAAPVLIDLEGGRRLMERYPALRDRMRITTPGALRKAVIARSSATLLDRAVSGLVTEMPEFSARSIASAWQGALVGAFVAMLPVALAWRPVETVFALHLATSLFFTANAALRLIAAFSARPIAPAQMSEPVEGQAETYSVLVALYKEAEVVPELLVALGRLVWPRSRLEIKLVCEEDDQETIAAISAHALRPSMELVLVPKAAPRTKPKALNYALQLCTGDFVAIYDAEDRPDPLQLVEARRAFARLPENVGCLQAPLDIVNGGENWLSGLFAMEYRALFHGILPWLARNLLMVPLGGTSNHFRREAIEKVMAWDAYNVTEDADLGLKLNRLGYRVDMITRPTLEEAPVDLTIWIKQRTRWMKGWIQTWLVHMRNPVELLRNVGLKSFVISQILFVGIFISALAHIFILVVLITLSIKFSLFDQLPALERGLLVVDAFNIGAGYIGLIALARRTLPAKKARGFWKTAAALPLYWIAMSVAAWRAAWQLLRNPHMWEKTPHRPHGAANGTSS